MTVSGCVAGQQRPGLRGGEARSSGLGQPRAEAAVFDLDVVSDESACALGRLLGLFATVDLLPDNVDAARTGDGQLRTALRIATSDAPKIELLVRKIARLTETIAIRVNTRATESPDAHDVVDRLRESCQGIVSQ